MTGTRCGADGRPGGPGHRHGTQPSGAGWPWSRARRRRYGFLPGSSEGHGVAGGGLRPPPGGRGHEPSATPRRRGARPGRGRSCGRDACHGASSASSCCTGCGIGEASTWRPWLAAGRRASSSRSPPREPTRASAAPERRGRRSEAVDEPDVRVVGCRVLATGQTEALHVRPAWPVERVSLREQVVWSPPPKRRGHADAGGGLPPDGHGAGARPSPRRPPEAVEDTVLVVGGGVAGLERRSGRRRAGHPVVLVEKDAELGG